MKKTLLAAALLAGFAGAASAQSSVTLYGIVDMGVRYQSIKPGTNFPTQVERNQFGMASGQSGSGRIGFRGVEDLGNGLKANFVLESAINLANGTGFNGFTRQSTIGLTSSSWGSIDMGRTRSAGTSQIGGIDPFGLNYGTGSLNASMGIAFIRYSNQIQYRTPRISGFSGAIGYSFDTGLSSNVTAAGTKFEQFSTNNKTRALSAGLRYANGPAVLAASYEGVKAPANAASGFSNATINAFLLAATYDFKVVKAFGAFARSTGGFLQGSRTLATAGATGGGDTNSESAALFRPGLDVTSWMVGLSAPIGAAGKVFASYQQRSLGGDTGVANAGTTNIPSIGYEYSLSKRTTGYAYYSYEKNVSNLSGSNSNTVGLGVRHTF